MSNDDVFDNSDDIYNLEEGTEDRNVLRPVSFNGYIGQNKIKENLKVYLKATKERGDTLDHCLFYGPPGLGKTTLANIIANELGVGITITSGPVIEKAGDLAAILTNLTPNQILFIDEIHRLNTNIEEILYPAMEDFKLDLVIGQGAGARSMRIDIEKFTLVGATTRVGLLSSPLRDRFGMMMRLEFYSDEELAEIITKGASTLGTTIDHDAALEVAKCSRGTPRLAHRIMRRMRDFAHVFNNGNINLKVALDGLKRLEIDNAGLDAQDRNLLEAIIYKYDGGPVGLDTLASTINEERDTIEDVMEPFLMFKGFIKKTPRGRVATPLAYEHLGVAFNPHEPNFIDMLEADDD